MNTRRVLTKEKNNVIRALKNFLEKRKEVLFAYVFGGFLGEHPYRDIDVAVYLKENIDEINASLYSEELSNKLTKLLGTRVDVVVLNTAPMWLKARALKGVLIIDKDPITRIALKLAVQDNIIYKQKHHKP